MSHTPFIRESDTRYSGVRDCVQDNIDDFNSAVTKATKGPTGEHVNCTICHDSLASSDGGLPNLFMVRLPACGHVFHELCLIQWLSPIKLTPTEKISTRTTDEGTSDTAPNGPYAPSSRPQDNHQQNRLVEYDPQAVRQPPEVLIDGMRALERRREATLRLQAILDAESPDDDLDEGEIGEDDDSEGSEIDDRRPSDLDLPWIDLEPQQLPPIVFFDDDPDDTDDYDRSRPSNRSGARSHRCPLCRQPAFRSSPPCHFDSLQLLRIRCRITDLAYALFEFDQDEQEAEDREDLVQFLHRRHLDTVALGEHETLPLPSEARAMFRQARWELRQRAYRYMQSHNLTATEQLRIVQLATIFENFHLKDTDIPFMFHPIPKRIRENRMTLDDVRKLNQDPRSFFSDLDFSNMVEAAADNFPNTTNEDADMVDAVDDETLSEMHHTDGNHIEADDGDSSDDEESEGSVS
ncbi:MAG: hypothetical protein LQ346_007977 [Caloplaca aetnensis]|nr:MAG: hypothetical protein LQ346_007977 [Caloplaca aetnensis]